MKNIPLTEREKDEIFLKKQFHSKVSWIMWYFFNRTSPELYSEIVETKKRISWLLE